MNSLQMYLDSRLFIERLLRELGTVIEAFSLTVQASEKARQFQNKQSSRSYIGQGCLLTPVDYGVYTSFGYHT